MQKHDLLCESNFLLYCAKHYDANQSVDDEEFLTDMNRIKYIKKLLTRYKQIGDLKERLILNHIIVLNNMFGPYHCSRILYLKLKDQFAMVKPFLILLNILPEDNRFYNIETPNTLVDIDLIPMDQNIISKLRQI